MKSKFIFSLHLLLALTLSANCQLQISDVRSMAMGNAAVACRPVTGIPKNLATTVGDKKSWITAGVSNYYFIKDLSPVFVSLVKSINENTSINAGLCRIGTKTFAEQFFEAGLAKRLGKNLSAALKIQYHQWILNESNYKNSHTLIPAIEIFSNPLKNLCFGVIIRNPVRSRMNTIEQKRLPSIINPGISYKVSEKIVLAISVTQQTDQPLSCQAGAEYQFHPLLHLRAGWQTIPVSESFGFGLNLSKINIDFSLQTHSVLGNSSSISLSFPL